MIISLKPWYTKLHIKFTNTTTSDEFYKFVYHTCLRNDYTGIVIDEPYEADTFVKETYLFKNIFYNIQITYLSEYEELNIPGKTDTYKVHYFCNEIFYDQLKSSIPCLGVYFNKYSDTHLTNVPVITNVFPEKFSLTTTFSPVYVVLTPKSFNPFTCSILNDKEK